MGVAMMVLGIDAGPTWCGWALLDFAVLSAPVWYGGGIENDVPSLFDTLIASGEGKLRPELVVLEKPQAVHNPKANVQVVATSWAGGRVEGHAEARGLATMALGVGEWRRAFIGHVRPGENADGKVKLAFYAIVRQAPKVTSDHARDAAGVACVGARRWRLRAGQVVLPVRSAR